MVHPVASGTLSLSLYVCKLGIRSVNVGCLCEGAIISIHTIAISLTSYSMREIHKNLKKKKMEEPSHLQQLLYREGLQLGSPNLSGAVVVCKDEAHFPWALT